jgi:phosphate transport system protein
MSHVLQKELDHLKRMLLSLSAVVEESVSRSVRAVERRDHQLAESIINSDRAVDLTEVDIEEECLKVMALHQPVASDLRFIAAALKINGDLERIGDLSVNIAERAVFLSSRDALAQPPINLGLMADKVQAMLHQSLDALVNMDAQLARHIGALDDEIDDLNRDNFTKIQDEIPRDLPHIESLMQYLSVSRYLERIADHASNIAEDVVYLIEGSIIRHKASESGSSSPNNSQ